MMTRSPRMTLQQLKRHVDRRLAKKADKSDVRQLERRMNARFAQMDARFEQVDSRFAQVDSRFAQIESRLDQIDSRFAQMNAHFEHLERQLGRLNRGLNGKTNGHRKILDEFQGRLTDLESHHG